MAASSGGGVRIAAAAAAVRGVLTNRFRRAAGPRSRARASRLEGEARVPRPRTWPRASLGGTARALTAIVAVILFATLAAVFAPQGRAARPPATTGLRSSRAPSPALAAALPVVQAKAGLRYAPGCAAGSRCLAFTGELDGVNAAVLQFAAPAGRACSAYLSKETGAWRAVDAVCAPASQLSPLVGHPATVQVGSSCAHVRRAPSLSGGVVTCLNDGTRVALDGGPTAGNGLLWWHVQGIGWMAQPFLQS
ncbi:MAG TPA: hypothetical protein VET65_03370 [Candidatus Limnocylindrales bacterium]|nr:hypothetical protein [Candidatus Limnocylindrales bacterium]